MPKQARQTRGNRTITSDFQHEATADHFSDRLLGVKNRTELRECITAEARGVLDPALMARIDAAVGRA